MLGLPGCLGKADAREIKREKSADVISFGGGDRLLRLHYLDRVGDPGREAVDRLRQRLRRQLAILLGDFELVGGHLQIDVGPPHVQINGSLQIGILGL